MRTTPTRLVACLVALTLFAAACGSSKSSTAKTDTTSASSSTTLAAIQVDEALAAKLPEKVKSAGKGAVNVQAFPDQAGANNALSSSRVDVVMLDTPVAEYQAKISEGAFEVIGESYGIAPYGIAVPKTSEYTGMTDALLGAVQKLNTTGAYTEILKRWGIDSGAITDFQINGATS